MAAIALSALVLGAGIGPCAGPAREAEAAALPPPPPVYVTVKRPASQAFGDLPTFAVGVYRLNP